MKSGNVKMKKILLFFIVAGLLSLIPSLSVTECTNLGGFDRFVLEQGNTVVLYLKSTPIGRFDVQTCSVEPSSKIELIKSDVCDGDDILVDGTKCTIMEVKPLGP